MVWREGLDGVGMMVSRYCQLFDNQLLSLKIHGFVCYIKVEMFDGIDGWLQ